MAPSVLRGQDARVGGLSQAAARLFRVDCWVAATLLAAVLVLCALFALMMGDETRNLRYQALEIPFGRQLVGASAVWIFCVGAFLRLRHDGFMRRELAALALLGLMFLWGQLSVAVTGRSYTQFTFFFATALAGLLISGTVFNATMQRGVIWSASLVCASVYLFGLAPFAVPQGLLDAEFLESADMIGGVIFRNSGLLLNNNALGSVLTTVIAYHSVTASGSWAGRIFPVYVLGACFISGNATALILGTLVLTWTHLSPFIPAARAIVPLRLVAMMLLLAALAGMLFFVPDYVAYKTESISSKFAVFAANAEVLMDDSSAWVWGARRGAELSESTLMDVFYYFGLAGFLLLGVLLALGAVRSGDPRDGALLSHDAGFFVVMVVLLVVQNSVLLPPVGLMFGLLLGQRRVAALAAPGFAQPVGARRTAR